jgi:hypothetical protein
MARGDKKKKGDAPGAATAPRCPRSRRTRARSGRSPARRPGARCWPSPSSRCSPTAPGSPEFEIGVRALVAGVIAYLLAWAAAVALWQRLIVHELKVGTERRRVEQEEAAEKLRAEQEAAAAAEDEEVVA